MLLNFAAALAALDGKDAVFTIVNAARPPADYLYAQLLPEQNRATFDAKSGTMTIRTTMAGLSGMDSTYAKVGAITMTSMREQTAKVTSEVTMDEATQRELGAILMSSAARNGGAVDQAFIRDEALNFLDKLITQSHLDMSEWLRGQAMSNGEIVLRYNGIELVVNYNIPAANVLAPRSGTSRYGGSASVFWDDVHEIQRILGYDVRAIILHPTLLSQAINNPANRIQVTQQTGQNFSIRRLLNDQGLVSGDNRDAIQIIAYGKEGEVYDAATPGMTVRVPFHNPTKMVGIGNGTANSPYVVGQGSTAAPQGALGYHHLAPTVEGGFRTGRWARLLVPEARPWQLMGQGVSNELPIIERPERIAIAQSTLA
jgi:hypothetical protein